MIRSENNRIYKRFPIIFILGVSIGIFTLTYFVLGILDRPTPNQVAGEYVEILDEVTPSPQLAKLEPSYGLPIRLVIPKINVDAGILYMGLTPQGDMEVPTKIDELGWYKFGPNPGEEGSAVIAGHLGVGEPGIFMNLDKLEIGDTFSVIDNNGQFIYFVVREIKTYNSTDHPSEVFFSDSGSHLNLITCSGDWDKTKQGMSKRLVVFADKT